ELHTVDAGGDLAGAAGEADLRVLLLRLGVGAGLVEDGLRGLEVELGAQGAVLGHEGDDLAHAGGVDDTVDVVTSVEDERAGHRGGGVPLDGRLHGVRADGGRGDVGVHLDAAGVEPVGGD